MTPYRWARGGDINAFFGLMLDNVAVMIILFTAVTSAKPIAEQIATNEIRFTPNFVLLHMIPGTALGVLFGDLVYTWMAFRLAKKTGRDDITAMPLGIDTPSTFGVAFLILLPALAAGWERYQDHEKAMQFAWHVGLFCLVFSGVFKIALAPFGNWVRSAMPRAGLLGSLAAIALALIAFLPLLLDGIAGVPVVGMPALLIILIALVAHRQLPGKFPGALAAVLVGVFFYLLGRGLENVFAMPVTPPLSDIGTYPGFQPFAMLSFWTMDFSWWTEVSAYSFNKLPVVLPFALATIVGGIDCTESAASAGDEYDTRGILVTEGFASLLAGLLGGVVQTTPYIGHPAFKKMGGRAAYTLATALVIGLMGWIGGFHLLFEWLPTGAMFGILIFVGLEITAQSFAATEPKHYPALAFAMLPALAYLALAVSKNVFLPGAPLFGERGEMILVTLRCLANGFLITGMLWAAMLAMLLDGRLKMAAVYCLIAAACAFFGVIHSPLGDEMITVPWLVPNLDAKSVRYQTPYHWSAAYGIMALMLLGLGVLEQVTKKKRAEEPKG
jgi:AGZA family xanthine/uracil permease-like MFS transporter